MSFRDYFRNSFASRNLANLQTLISDREKQKPLDFCPSRASRFARFSEDFLSADGQNEPTFVREKNSLCFVYKTPDSHSANHGATAFVLPILSASRPCGTRHKNAHFRPFSLVLPHFLSLHDKRAKQASFTGSFPRDGKFSHDSKT
ncbi:MAG TPA: hypothetical protein VGJ04_03520 [Pirellulales bacterium]